MVRPTVLVSSSGRGGRPRFSGISNRQLRPTISSANFAAGSAFGRQVPIILPIAQHGENVGQRLDPSSRCEIVEDGESWRRSREQMSINAATSDVIGQKAVASSRITNLRSSERRANLHKLALRQRQVVRTKSAVRDAPIFDRSGRAAFHRPVSTIGPPDSSRRERFSARSGRGRAGFLVDQHTPAASAATAIGEIDAMALHRECAPRSVGRGRKKLIKSTCRAFSPMIA